MENNLGDSFQDFYRDESVKYHSTRYETKYGVLFKKLHHFVLSRILKGFPRQAKVLEVACGTGHTTGLLTESGFVPVSCDLSPEMMAHARRTANNDERFVRANAYELPFPDDTFDLVISTRFLHLLPSDKQEKALVEMLRVLKKGGRLVVDFDNFFSRWLWAVPYLFYNLIWYQRIAPYSVYNRVNPTVKMISRVGVGKIETFGVGGTHLFLFGILSTSIAYRFGLLHQTPPLRLLAEQFVVSGVKD